MIKERPGEPRFGFDVSRDGADRGRGTTSRGRTCCPRGRAGAGGPGAPAPTLGTPSSTDEQEKLDQHAEDVHVRWGPDMTSADAAYVLFQAPVLVAVHAAEMLTPKTGDGAGLPRP